MSAVICRGRFILDAMPVQSNLASAGHLYRWSVSDLDDDQEYDGLAADMDCALLEAMTKAKEIRKA